MLARMPYYRFIGTLGIRTFRDGLMAAKKYFFRFQIIFC
jgi:hypothetical protein